MGRLLNSYGEIKNEGKVLNELRERIPKFKNLSGMEITKEINRSVKKTDITRWFDFGYIELEENEVGKEVMWLDTGYKQDGETVYIQFTGGNPWTGAFVGTEDGILEYQRQYQEQKNAGSTERLEKLNRDLGVDVTSIEGVTVIMDASDDRAETDNSSKEKEKEEYLQFLNMLHSKLLIPNSWTVESLRNYVEFCIARINHCLEKGKNCDSYAIFNSDKTMVLINSGLLDKFGKYIMLLTRVYNNDKSGKPTVLSFTSTRISGGKVFLSERRFEKNALSREI